MSEPITNEQREAAKLWTSGPHQTIPDIWLRGYEAMVVDLEQKIEDKSLKILALTENMMEAAEASSVKVLHLERRLKIAEDALRWHGYDPEVEALAAMAKEEKS